MGVNPPADARVCLENLVIDTEALEQDGSVESGGPGADDAYLESCVRGTGVGCMWMEGGAAIRPGLLQQLLWRRFGNSGIYIPVVGVCPGQLAALAESWVAMGSTSAQKKKREEDKLAEFHVEHRSQQHGNASIGR